MAASVKVALGSYVWVEDTDEAWLDGEVVEANDVEVKVKCETKTVTAKVNAVHPKDPEFPELGVDDMTKLAYLHEPGLLLNLKSRYNANEIYTYTGNILIAVNPFKRLPHLYGNEIMERYKGSDFGDLSPHPFAVADSAYRKMINEGVSQAILVSGESGAGKTESTKMLMQYLAYMGGKAESEGRSVEQQVLESNPVLEAFGNAKTVRNNNSSRFGKFVEIQFNQMGRISGAAIRTYLLERSRVCQVSDPERNYHCFYMLCAAPEQEIERYKLGKPSTFHYLNQSNCHALSAFDDSKEYLDTRKAMDVVGITSEEQDAIFRVVAAILHLGNIEFVKGEESDAAEPKDDKSRFHLKVAAELFMCDEKALEDSLCKRVMVTRGESITKSLDPGSAALSRDALAKIVYSKLFDWLVTTINNSIGQDPSSKYIIGVLDIYGFESFKTNSFEQFCINLTNEKLQQHFNQHVFKMEQEEYTKEEIDWSYIEFIDNQDVLDLIEKKPGGIIALIDEACMFPRSTHETLAQKLYQTFNSHKRFTKPKLARTDFTICHYAGDVTYQTELFLDKNKDYVVGEHQSLMNSSECSFVSSLFPKPREESSKSSKFSSIGSQFKQQLQSLLETLSTTEPHYVRCVKPNNVLKPDIFENLNVLHQLRCGGVMEAIRISCAGYPTRKSFSEFLTRFRILGPEATNKSFDEVNACKKLLAKVDLKGFQIGKTKVFLRAGQMAELDAHRAEALGHSARIIQRKVLSYQSRKKYLMLQSASTEIQAFCRGHVARLQFKSMRREAASLRIQKQARTYICQTAYKRLCVSAIYVQTGLRAMAARVELQYRMKRRAAIIIQSQTRRFLCRRRFLRMRKAAITTQCGWRVKIARRELLKLKMAAKETGALQDAKNKLEKELEELTSCLELEKLMRMKLEEAKTQEVEELKAALDDMKLQLGETQETKSEEILKLQSALQDMQLEFEELSKDLEMTHDLASENEHLKELVSSLQSKTDVSETKYEETSKLSEGQIKQEVPVIDHDVIIKLEAENEQLKTLVSSLEKKIDALDRKHEETSSNITEQLKESASSDYEIVSDLSAENERLKALVSSLEKKSNENDGSDSPNEQKEGTHMLKEEDSITDDVSVDNEMTNKLAAENKELYDLVDLLEKKVQETEKKYEEASKLCEERLQQVVDAETKLIGLKTSMQMLEEKVSDMEAEEKILRQQALMINSASKKMSPQVSFSGPPPMENGHHVSLAPIPSGKFGAMSFKRTLEQQPHEYVDVLLSFVSQNIGFSHGKPVAAFTIYKCLIHWKLFEAEKTSIFDRIVPLFRSAIENPEDNDNLTYWLTNTSTLLFLLQRSLKTHGTNGASANKPPQPTSFFGRMTQGFRSTSSESLSGDVVQQVDARVPALLFRQQLTAYVETIFGIFQENVKRELEPVLSSCIQGLKDSSHEPSAENLPAETSEQNSPAKPSEEIPPEKLSEGDSPAKPSKESPQAKTPEENPQAKTSEESPQTKPSEENTEAKTSEENPSATPSAENTPAESWQGITDLLNRLLGTLKKNYVPMFLAQKIFSQTFQGINVQVFNSLLERECCTYHMGKKVNAWFNELEAWCSQATEEFVGSSWDELKHTRQAVVLLVTEQKSKITYDDLTTNLCPALSTQQLYRICTFCKIDDNEDRNVSPGVISNLKLLITDEDEDSRSFLLDNDSSVPFAADEISNCMEEKEFANVKPAVALADNPNFHFLKG
ncbi:PREDICTED: myosin-10 isoform X2 [Brassica oleracea var. oleracea]|uniref:myosin-10 isoform X2 n=1 Tax=Brassica oleracea var. oleracea TaxID=109376 RepID=UPI0006A72813|nr:PREDICTED: myosin-10 isoform X2 [Brassica oleracea var. oleracea]